MQCEEPGNWWVKLKDVYVKCYILFLLAQAGLPMAYCSLPKISIWFKRKLFSLKMGPSRRVDLMKRKILPDVIDWIYATFNIFGKLTKH